MMKKAKRPARATLPSADEIRSLAQGSSYIGSPEHKAGRWWGGTGSVPVGSDGQVSRPKKPLTTICPLRTDEDLQRATGWIREAIDRQCCLFVEGDCRYPKHVWHTDAEGQHWVGRCTNSEQGLYKGWPAKPEEIEELQRRKRR